MKRKVLLYSILFVCVFIAIHPNYTKGEKPIPQDKNLVSVTSQNVQVDTSKINFKIPLVKCGNVKWSDPAILDWLTNFCLDKCDDLNSSGFKFSGIIKNSKKSWSLKVTIKTDREYLQPVKFNPIDGTFDGKIYFDKTNRLETPIKITLRDSNRLTIETFVITLTE
jgi:hypothetical protein